MPRSKRPSVLVLGGASLDAVVHLSDASLPVVDRWYRSVGGTGAGKALNLAALGVDVSLHAVLGRDEAGREVEGALGAGGVRLLPRYSSYDTQRHTNLMLPDGGRVSLPVVPAAEPADFAASEVAGEMAAADVLVPSILEYVRPCLGPARASGKPVWVDLHDWDGEQTHHQAFAAAADVAVVSSARLADPDALLDRLVAGGARLAVCTHGAGGATALEASGRRVHQPALPGVAVEDTNGAGDAFTAGLLLGEWECRGLATSLAYATAAGAVCVGARGLAAPGTSAEAVRALAARVPAAQRR